MAVRTGDIIRIADVVNYINTYLKNRIESQIVYNRENPPHNFHMADVLMSGRTLAPMPVPDLKGKVINSNVLSSFITSTFVTWCMVRNLIFHCQTGGWSNGGGVPYSHEHYSGYAYFGDVPPACTQAIITLNMGNITGTIIRPQSLQAFCDLLYSKWQQLALAYQKNFSRTICHGNCHSSCHGSGGRR